MARHLRVAAVVLAGGAGVRAGGDGNKAYLPLAGRSLASWSLNLFGTIPSVTRRVLVIRADDRREAATVADRELDDPSIEIILGGSSRHQSEWAALNHLIDDVDRGLIDLILIHDAARPLVSKKLTETVIAAAEAVGGALPGLRSDDIRSMDGGVLGAPGLAATTDMLVRVQTPQVFRAQPLINGYKKAWPDGFEGTDTASTVELYCPDLSIRWIEGDPRNFKITFPWDILLAERILADANYLIE